NVLIKLNFICDGKIYQSPSVIITEFHHHHHHHHQGLGPLWPVSTSRDLNE
ncbi:hypothetical protein L9F63_011531, partial [Diploptera punctata]